MSQITVKNIVYTSILGQSCALDLHAPVNCPDTVSADLLCRLVLPRLPLSPSARLLLGLILDERSAGLPPCHTYAGLGEALGRGLHTVIRAAAELRTAGLLLTTRMGCRNGEMLFACSPLVDWASSIVQDAPERAAATPEPRTPVAVPPAADNAPARVPDAPACGERVVDDRPNWPAVPDDWRQRYGIPRPDDDLDAKMAIPLGVKPWLGPIPRLPSGGFDMDKLLRMPYQLVVDDDEAFHVLYVAKCGEPDKGPVAMKLDDPDVDASEERDAEISLAGQQVDDDDDDFRFDAGADTAETDVGHGVVANPDL